MRSIEENRVEKIVHLDVTGRGGGVGCHVEVNDARELAKALTR